MSIREIFSSDAIHPLPCRVRRSGITDPKLIFRGQGGSGGGGVPLDTAFSISDGFPNGNDGLLDTREMFTLQGPSGSGMIHNNPEWLEAQPPAHTQGIWSYDSVTPTQTGTVPSIIGEITSWIMLHRGMQTDPNGVNWMLFAWTPDPNKLHMGTGYGVKWTGGWNESLPSNSIYRLDNGVATLLASYPDPLSQHNSYDNRYRVRFDPDTGLIQSDFSVNYDAFSKLASATDTTYKQGRIGFACSNKIGFPNLQISDFIITGFGSAD